MPRDGSKNLVPQNKRTKDEQKKIAQKGGKASGEARRKKKGERDRLEAIMRRVPNMDVFLETGSNRKAFDMLGLSGGDIDDIEALTDLKLVQAALMGDLNAKKYLDERMGRSPTLELKRRELIIKEKLADAEAGARADAAVDEWLSTLESR